MSGYKLSNGNDLSTIFAARTSATSVVTGYTLLNGDDISSLYEPGVSTGLITGYKLQNTENDIATVFKQKSPSPLDLSGCCLWMDASDQSTVTLSSTKVSKWTDKSVNGYTMNQTDTGKQPTYNATTLNGLPVLGFSLANTTFLYGDANANAFAVGYNCYSLFAVCKHSSARGGYVFAKSLAGGANGRILFGRDTVLYSQFTHQSGWLGNINDSNNNYRILELIVNRVSGNDYVYQNGTQIGTTYTYTSDTSTNYTNNYTMLIGAYNNGSGGLPPLAGVYLDGNIAEIVAVANTYDMTTNKRQWIEGYLAWKWGLQTLLSGTHPYYNNAPTGPPPS